MPGLTLDIAQQIIIAALESVAYREPTAALGNRSIFPIFFVA
jgi:hypothetical protein